MSEQATLVGRKISIRALRQDDIEDAGGQIYVTDDSDLSDYVAVLVEDLAEGIAAVINLSDGSLVFQNSDGDGGLIADPTGFVSAVSMMIDAIR